MRFMPQKTTFDGAPSPAGGGEVSQFRQVAVSPQLYTGNLLYSILTAYFYRIRNSTVNCSGCASQYPTRCFSLGTYLPGRPFFRWLQVGYT